MKNNSITQDHYGLLSAGIPASFTRNLIGFDEMLSSVVAGLKTSADSSFPPFNVEKLSENTYEITLAVAGFTIEDLEITAQKGLLVIKGNPKDERGSERVYIHRGLAQRAFTRKFALEENVEVSDAKIENGLLVISLVRHIPEEQQPKVVKISA